MKMSVEQAVLEFQEKFKTQQTLLNLLDQLPLTIRILDRIAQDVGELANVALKAYSQTHDPRLLRAHLIAEEFGELVQAMRNRNERDVLDGSCDLVYVAVGTATSFDLPFDEGFAEIHRSNMTKSTAREANSDSKAIGERVTGKGPDFEPPRLLSIIKEYRLQGPTDDDVDEELQNENTEELDENIDDELSDDDDDDGDDGDDPSDGERAVA